MIEIDSSSLEDFKLPVIKKILFLFKIDFANFIASIIFPLFPEVEKAIIQSFSFRILSSCFL